MALWFTGECLAQYTTVTSQYFPTGQDVYLNEGISDAGFVAPKYGAQGHREQILTLLSRATHVTPRGE